MNRVPVTVVRNTSSAALPDAQQGPGATGAMVFERILNRMCFFTPKSDA